MPRLPSLPCCALAWTGLYASPALAAGPWSLTATAGSQSLGFAPAALNLTGGLGAERALLTRERYRLRVGAEAGGFQQPLFARGAYLDASLQQALVTRTGLYGSLDVVAGAQRSSLPQTGWSASEDGGLSAASPRRAGSRLGLGAAVGVDLGGARVFGRYRQQVWTPFMLGNDLPFMGAVVVSVGIAVNL